MSSLRDATLQNTWVIIHAEPVKIASIPGMYRRLNAIFTNLINFIPSAQMRPKPLRGKKVFNKFSSLDELWKFFRNVEIRAKLDEPARWLNTAPVDEHLINNTIKWYLSTSQVSINTIRSMLFAALCPMLQVPWWLSGKSEGVKLRLSSKLTTLLPSFAGD